MKPGSALASHPPLRGCPRQQGFALLIMLVIVVMGSMFAITSQLEFVSHKYSRDESSLRSLTLAKEALLGWAATYRDRYTGAINSTPVFGYLPCPDSVTGDGTVPSPSTTPQNCGNGDLAAVGLLPYQELGLPDLRDADGNCLWYVVSGTFKNNVIATSTLVNWDTQGQFTIVDSTGNQLAYPGDANGGVAAVIIAPGTPLTTQDRSGMGFTSSPTPCNVNPATFTPPTSQALSRYMDSISIAGSKVFSTFAVSTPITIAQGTRESQTNNDLLVWITPKEIFDRIKKRSDFTNLATGTPVGQVNKLIELAKTTLESRIFDDITNNGGTPRAAAPYLTTPTNQVAYTQGTAWQIGELPDLTQGTYTVSGDYNKYYDNWKDQFRYALCSNLNNYCLTINGLKCDGALLFGGESTSLISTGGPRPTNTRQLSNYFEGSALTLVSGGSTSSYTGTQDTYSTATRSADVVRCLYTRALSFSQDLASFQTTKSAGTTVTTVAATSVTLATTGTGGAAGTNYGCFWYPTAVPFGNGVRIYFRFRFSSKSEGFTFALADATSNPTTAMCGAGDAAMGYSGNNGAILPIKYPKMAVEFDTKTDAAYNDPSSGGVSTRHITFDYWGNSTGDPNGTDDNVHGNGGSNGDPVNPVSSTTACTTVGSGNKFCRNAMSNNQNHDVHIDITRGYSATTGQGTYTLKAYFAFNGSYANCPLAVLTNVAADASSSCNPAISDTITINDLAGVGEAMKRVFVGFTTSQGTANQSVTISAFQIKPY